jgi:hypothetical protein
MPDHGHADLGAAYDEFFFFGGGTTAQGAMVIELNHHRPLSLR